MTNYTLLSDARSGMCTITYINRYGVVCTDYERDPTVARQYAHWLVTWDGATEAVAYQHGKELCRYTG